MYFRYIVLVFVVVLFIVQAVWTAYHHHKKTSKSKSKEWHFNLADFPTRAFSARANTHRHKYYANDVYSFESYTPPPHGVCDLRDKCPPVYDQGLYGDCTNQSTAFLVEYYCRNVLGVAFRPSRWLLNFMVQRFHSDAYQTSIVPVELQVYGNAIHPTNTGGANVYQNIAVMMMSGMVEESQFPFPTPKQSASYQKVLDKLHGMYEKYKTQNITPDELRHFIQSYNRFLQPLRLPSKALYRNATHNRVTKCFNIDATSIEDIRKCLYYVGPVALDIALPYWLHFPLGGVTAASDIGCICNDFVRTHRTHLNANEIKFFKELVPRFVELYYQVKQKVWSKTIMKHELDSILVQKLSKQMRQWLKYPTRKVLRKSVWHAFVHQTSVVNPSCRLPDEVVRERCTCHYPHANIRKYKAMMNKQDDHLFNKTQALYELLNDYAINFSWSYSVNSSKKEAALKEADSYFKGLVIGGHSMAIVGYDDTRRVFIVRNSWGESWGDNGYFYLSYDYFSDDAFNPFNSYQRWIGQMVCVAGVELGE